MSNDNNNLNEKLKRFCSNMTELQQMSTMFSNHYFEQMEENDLLDENLWQKLDTNLTFVYANTSIYWLYLLLKQQSAVENHPIKDELIRVRKYMNDYQLLQKERPKLNVRIAKNIIKHALWDPVNDQNNTSKRQKTADQNGQD